MTEPRQCREIKSLNPLVQVQLNKALAEIRNKGINPLVIETLRTKERQYWLYGQGRTAAQCVSAGVPVSYRHNGNQVTWTLNSIHLSGCAVDVIAQRKSGNNMVAIWDAKDKENKTIQNIMIKYGFEAGANWKSTPDSPHFQVKGIKGKVYSTSNTNYYITTMVQVALNKKANANLDTDGVWGKKTTAALNKWRREQKWRETGSIGTTALKKLIG